jgi:hypothetical protein
MRGVDVTVIGLVAFLGIAAMVGWIIYQGSVGTERAWTIIGSSERGKAFTQLENVKRTLTQDLVFSAHQASLIVASQGGSYVSQRYWMCGEKSAPTENEVLFALSNTSSGIMQAYINATDFKNATVKGYKCAGVYDPGEDLCSQSSSTDCEIFSSSATTGRIDIWAPERLSYEGSLQNEISSNRFFWIYHRLKKVFDANRFKGWATGYLRDHCLEPTPDEEKVRAAMFFACDELQKEFDQYVNVTCKELCVSADQAVCLNELPCEVPKIEKSLCFENAQSFSGKGEAEQPNKGKISLQASTGSLGVEIRLKDEKYNIPGTEGVLEPMVWNLRVVTSLPQVEHRPIDKLQLD